MKTFDALFNAVPQWQELRAAIDARLSAAAHGDFPKWQAAIDALPELTPEGISLDDTVTVTGTASAEAQGALREALMHLHPWRKGPFSLFGVDIDCEWRSDWKWQRVVPHLEPLRGHRVLDVGCGNGYFGWRMLDAGAALVAGVDPTSVFYMQHLAVNKFLNDERNWVIPLKFEDLPTQQFDSVFSMGVVYHRPDPASHAQRLFEFTKPGGQVVLESLVVRDAPSLQPPARYARMRNVSVIPSVDRLCRWLIEAGFTDVALVDVTQTTLAEQRSTTWMRFESLEEALDPDNRQLTVEGLPAPVRAVAVGRKPA
jgi:tRNA (mo5U34)-methyltransferase